MKTKLWLRLIASLGSWIACTTAGEAAAAPCTTAGNECAHWIVFGDNAQALFYSTQSLDARNTGITRALVIIHGALRTAPFYFRTGVVAATMAGALDDTIVVAPRFASNNGRSCRDGLAAGEVNWPCIGNSWRAGGPALGNEALTSYDFADEILRRLANKDTFPDLKRIVVAGHSAGGQFVARYAMASEVPDALGVPVSYVIANPSSYAYLDTNRPLADGTRFQPFDDAAACPGYNRWPYGLQDRSGYTARTTDVQLKQRWAVRSVTFLLGALDTHADRDLDKTCPAMAQGPNRLARGEAYTRYLTTDYAANPIVTIVPGCGHSARCMFTSGGALPALFPPP